MLIHDIREYISRDTLREHVLHNNYRFQNLIALTLFTLFWLPFSRPFVFGVPIECLRNGTSLIVPMLLESSFSYGLEHLASNYITVSQCQGNQQP